MVVICSLGFLRPVEDVVTLPRLFIVEEPDPLLFYPLGRLLYLPQGATLTTEPNILRWRILSQETLLPLSSRDVPSSHR